MRAIPELITWRDRETFFSKTHHPYNKNLIWNNHQQFKITLYNNHPQKKIKKINGWADFINIP